MIHLVTHANRHLYERQLAQFFALYDQRGDPYDDQDAAYLVGMAADGSLGVGIRIRPTLRGSIMADRFPDLIASDRALLHRASTLEASRLVVACRGDSEDRRVHGELALAMLEAAQLLGASRIVGIVHLAQWPLLDGGGWRIMPLGTPIPGRSGTRIAFEVGVTPGDLRAMRDAWAMERALIYLDDHIAGGFPIELVGGHADEWGRLTGEDRRSRLIARELVDAPAGWSPAASHDADRNAIEETLQILDTIINQNMLHRPDNDLRQQGAITLLSVAQSRLRTHLNKADVALSPADLDLPALQSTH